MSRDTIWRLALSAAIGAGLVALLQALPSLPPTEQRLGTTRSIR